MYLELLSEIQGFGFRTTLFGIPFLFSFWTLVLAAVLSMMAKEYITKQMRSHPKSSHTVAGIGAGLTVLGSIMIHEGSHSLVGWYIGLTTVDGGMSWWGAYVKFDRMLNTLSPVQEIMIGLSGVGANAIIAIIATALVWLSKESILENAIQFVAVFNYRLALFNLLPIIGLDGSKVLDGLLRPWVPEGVIAFIVIGSTIALFPYFLGFRKSKMASKFELLLERI